MSRALAAALLLAAAAVRAEPDPRVEFSVDPRLELLSVVELLVDRKPRASQLMPREDHEYVKRARAHFGRFKKHPAVLFAAKHDPADFSFGFEARSVALMGCSAPPALKLRHPASLGSDSQALTEEWLAGLRSFWRDSGFEKFLAENGPLLDPQLAMLREAVEPVDYIRKFEAYSGEPFRGRLRLFWSPFLTPPNHGARIMKEEDGSYELTGAFSINRVRERWSVSKVWHELAHAQLDRLADGSKELESREGLLDKMSWGCHRVWKSCAIEQLNDAIWGRLLILELGEGRGEELGKSFLSDRYPHTPLLMDRLKEYEADRARWKRLSDFYPRLVDAFPAR